MGPIGYPETSVRNHHYSLRNNPEERSSHNSDVFRRLSKVFRELMAVFATHQNKNVTISACLTLMCYKMVKNSLKKWRGQTPQRVGAIECIMVKVKVLSLQATKALRAGRGTVLPNLRRRP